MSDARWERIKAVFEAAMAAPVPERMAVLDRECGGDAGLRREVESLLDARTQAFVRTGGAAHALADATTGSAPIVEKPGEVIGHYKLLQVIGEGGFGTVFLAEQSEPVRRKVALKIIKLGMDTRQVIARFEAERQALAMMDHPHIARVLDAGATESGRPYFVMEYVKGDAITQFADAHKLGVQERLELFGHVCAAVQHAHTKGIIHRDLKPGNVLVSMTDGKPFAKVIDFGIAKATGASLTDKTLFTEHRQLIGTPEYMSPEQAEGSPDIDTRTDVYALGVLLYELLTGLTPFDAKRLRSAAFGEMQRIIREEEPLAPSVRLFRDLSTLAAAAAARRSEPARLGTEIKGELDWIVMKALDKERARRYESPGQFAADVERYMEGAPILAAPASLTYRSRKFIRRNRGPVMAGLLVLLVLFMGIAGTSTGYIQAVRRAQSERLAKDAAFQSAAEATKARDLSQAAIAEAERQRDAAEGELYVASIASAQESLQRNETERVRACLETSPARLRDWEWRYLAAAADQSLVSIPTGVRSWLKTSVAREAGVIAVSGETKGRKLFGAWDISSGLTLCPPTETGGDIHAIHAAPTTVTALIHRNASGSEAEEELTTEVWDMRASQSLCQISQSNIFVAAFSPDGTRVATGGAFDSVARVWDSRTGAEQVALPTNAPRSNEYEGGVTGLWFSPTGRYLATALDPGYGEIWDTTSATRLATFSEAVFRIGVVEFSPDEQFFVSASNNGTVHVRRVATGELAAALQRHDSTVGHLAFDRTGSRLITASADRTVRIWDMKTFEQITVLRGHDAGVGTAEFSPDGSRVVTGSNRLVRVWDAFSGRMVAALRGHNDGVMLAQFIGDGSRIVSCALDGTVRVWDAEAGVEPNVGDSFLSGSGDAFLSPDGTRLAATGAYGASVWDTRNGKQLLHLKAVGSIDMAEGEFLLARVDGHWGVWSISTAERIATLERLTGTDGAVVMDRARLSPDGRRVVIWANRVDALIWNVRDGRAVSLPCRAVPGKHAQVRFSLDGRSVVTSGFDDSDIVVWNADSGQKIASTKDSGRNWTEVQFSPQGDRVFLWRDEGVVQVWDFQRNEIVGSIHSEDGLIRRIEANRDGTHVAAAVGDSSAMVWEVSGWRPVLRLSGHESRVNSVRFNPSGSRIVTSSEDETVRVWDGKTGRQLAILRGHRLAPQEAWFSPDGTRIISSSQLNPVKVWDSIPWRERYGEARPAAPPTSTP